jgi:hypothetical protein
MMDTKNNNEATPEEMTEQVRRLQAQDFYWMFRTEDDNIAADIKSSHELRYPANDRVSVVGEGGIFFACCRGLPAHLLHYAEAKQQESGCHFFMCPMPLPEYPTTFISNDLICLSVRAGESIGDEFVKAGQQGETFAPDVLIWVRMGRN